MTNEDLKTIIEKHLDRAGIYVDGISEEDKIYRGVFDYVSIKGKRVKDIRVGVKLPKDYDGIIADDLNKDDQWAKGNSILYDILQRVEEDINKDLKVEILWYGGCKFGLGEYKISFHLGETDLSMATKLFPPDSYSEDDPVDFDIHLYTYLRVIGEFPFHFLPTEEELKKSREQKEEAGEEEEEKEEKQTDVSKLVSILLKAVEKAKKSSGSEENENTKTEEKEDKYKKVLRAFGSASCQVYLPDAIKETFSDFIGYEDVKEQIRSAVIVKIKKAELLRKLQEQTRVNPELSGAPYSILFEGPPGVGKTMMAKIIAKETGLIMVYVSSDQILSKWVGETESNIREIFQLVKKFSDKKFLLFFDEIDTIGSSRNEESRSWERSHLLTMMQWLEGIETSHNYVFVATTNRIEDLDRALLSRFKEIISFKFPDQKDIMELLKYYAKHLTEEDYKTLAEMLAGKSPRDIKNICEIVEQRQIMLLKGEELELPSVDLYKKVIWEKVNN